MKTLVVLSQYWKGVVGFAAPGAVIIGAAVTSASDGGSHITGAEIVTAVVAMVVTAGGVVRASNAPKPADDTGNEEPFPAHRLARRALVGEDGPERVIPRGN